MALIDARATRAMGDVIRADLVISGANTPETMAHAAEISVATLTRTPHHVSVARDATVPSLMRVVIDGPLLALCVVIEV